MKHIGINVQLPYMNNKVRDFIYDLFDKKTMLVCMGEKIVVKKNINNPQLTR